MNVYLALACTLAAGVDGIVTKVDPGEPTDRDLYSLTPEEAEALGIRRLPRNLLDAIGHLQKDALVADVLGQTMLKSYVAYKLDEWERYHQAVTDWEVEEYLRLY
jgi:glutamine synthetase